MAQTAQTATARELLEKLVSFPTVSSETNLELMDWVEGWLATRGVAATRVYNSDKTKASLYAQIGPAVAGGVILSGHTDVVPTKGQPWDSDPFEVVERGGRLYGRGTCDMKGFDALALAAVDLALAADLKRPLQIALSYDEEVGCLGAPALIDEIAAHLPRAACAIIGEPSMMDVVTGHKGSIGFSVHLRGHEVHSSLIHQGVSAVMMGAKLIDWANRMNAQNAAKTPSPMAALFTPPYSTLHVGKIAGGTAHNITAKDCDFTLAMRIVPDDSIEGWTGAFMAEVARIEGEMQAIHPDTGIDVAQIFDVPALRPEKVALRPEKAALHLENGGAAEELTRRITGDNASHAVSYGTEAGQFQRAGFSAVICGPGSITQAHQANEYLSLEQLAAGMDFMHAIVKHLSEE